MNFVKNGGSTQRVIKIKSEVLPCHFCEAGGAVFAVMAVKARFRS